MIRDENGRLSGYVFMDLDTSKRDIGSYVADAKKAIRENVQLPPGYQLIWSGQFEFMERVKERLIVVVPITIFLVFLLLYFNTRSITKTMIIFLAVPFSAVGAIWFLYLLGYNMSIAVWVGLIALMGVDAETGMFMLLYLDLAYNEAEAKGKDEELGRPAGGDRRGRRETASTQSDDRGRDVHGPGSDHVVNRRGSRCHETDCCADDRRNLHLLHSGTRCLSGNLCHLEMELRTEETAKENRCRGRHGIEGWSKIGEAGAKKKPLS